MAHSSYIDAREIIRTAAEIRHRCADMARLARFEVAEVKAGTRKAIAESRELMAEADAVIAGK